MKILAVLFLIATLAICFEIENIHQGGNPSSPVSKTGGLTWNCQSCSDTCGYGKFSTYCADAYFCVCTFLNSCPTSVKNIC